MLVLYTLLRPNELLKNAVRAMIYQTVKKNPGISVGEIAAVVGVKHQTVSYHLDLLRRKGYIVDIERGNKRLHFLKGAGYTREDRDLICIAQSEAANLIIEKVLATPAIIKTDVANALGITRTAGGWHIKKLTECGIITEQREGGQCHLYVVPEKIDRLREVIRGLPLQR